MIKKVILDFIVTVLKTTQITLYKKINISQVNLDLKLKFNLISNE